MRRVLIAALTLALLPIDSRAQGVANTLDELRLLVRPGDMLTVTDGSGQRVRGRLSDLSAASLVLTVDREQRQFLEGQLTTVSQRYADSLGNGALIGLCVGGGMVAGGLAVTTHTGGRVSIGEALLVVGLYGGLGAGIGTGIDALIPAQRVVFERRAVTGVSLVAGPILGRRRLGARVFLGF